MTTPTTGYMVVPADCLDSLFSCEVAHEKAKALCRENPDFKAYAIVEVREIGRWEAIAPIFTPAKGPEIPEPEEDKPYHGRLMPREAKDA